MTPPGIHHSRSLRASPLLLAAAALCLCLPVAAQTDGRRTLGAEHLEIKYWSEHEDLALVISQRGREDLDILTRTLDLKITGTILVEIVRNHAELNQRVGRKMPTWTQGVSLHHRGHVILKPLTGKNFTRLLTHELTHVALDMKMAQEGKEAPRWLHEGLAQWMEGELTAAQKSTLGRAALEDRLLKLHELEGAFAGDRETVDLAYAESFALIQVMVEHGPKGALGRFLEYFASTGDELLALRRCMGMSVPAIEKRWLQQIRTEHVARAVPLTIELLIFAAMALIFLVAVMVKMNQAREIRERMQAEEEMERLMAGVELDESFDDWPEPDDESDEPDDEDGEPPDRWEES